jgi:hypothetical protein
MGVIHRSEHRLLVVVGEPIHFTRAEVENSSRENYQILSNRVMDAIAAIKIE